MWSSSDSIRHSVRPMPSLKLLGSNAGIDTKASMSPVVDVHRDERARLVAHAPRGIFLQPGVDRQLDGLAAAVGLGLELAHQLAARGEFDPLPAGLAAQVLFERLFKAFLADLEARRDEKRVLVPSHNPWPRRRRHSRPGARPPEPAG